MKISAFVGHSFLPDDKDVVDDILEELEKISKVIPSFSWDHALDPESKELKRKVLEKIDGKNLFIGICTSKELAAPSSLYNDTLWGKQKKIETKKLTIKTSDWIIQEIGLAVGRGMNLILLIEDGVRKPGGLQGDIEYIPFNRENPKACFSQLSMMIASLTRDVGSYNRSLEDSTSKEDAEKKVSVPEKHSTNPQANWEYDEYRHAILQCLFDKDLEKANLVLKQYGDKVDDDQVHAELEALKLSATQWLGLGDVTKQLTDLAAKFEENQVIGGFLASHYKDIDLPQQSIKIYEELIVKAGDQDKAVDLVINIGDCLVAQELYNEAINHVNKYKDEEVISLKNKLKILRWTASCYENQGLFLKFVSLAEYYLEEYPNDDDLRFKLAYRYDEVGYSALSIKHYKVLCSKRSRSVDWNNLGVAYSKNSLEGKSVDSYKKSIELGGTLAASNLSNNYINQGFYDEAELVSKRATEDENCDSKVVESIALINKNRKEEMEKEKEYLQEHKAISSFMINSGKFSLMPQVKSGEYLVKGSQVNYILKVFQNRVEASYNFEKQRTTSRIPSLTGKSMNLVDRYSVQIEGVLVGQMAYITKIEQVNGRRLNVLGYGDPKKLDGIFIFSEDLTKIETLMEGEKVTVTESISRVEG